MHMYITIYCSSEQTDQVERDVKNHTSRGKPSYRTSETDPRSPWGAIEARLRTTALARVGIQDSLSFLLFALHFV